ncbi:hypothetical protein D3C77_343350 [compost metagenome]
MGDCGQAAQRPDDITEHAPRQVQGPHDTERCAKNDASQATEQEAHQAPPLPDQFDASDLLPLMHYRQGDRLIQQHVRNLLFHPRQQAVVTAMPARHQLVAVIEHLDVGQFFRGRDQGQGFIGRAAVIEHHGGLDRVVDRARDQVQVVVGI